MRGRRRRCTSSRRINAVLGARKKRRKVCWSARGKRRGSQGPPRVFPCGDARSAERGRRRRCSRRTGFADRAPLGRATGSAGDVSGGRESVRMGVQGEVKSRWRASVGCAAILGDFARTCGRGGRWRTKGLGSRDPWSCQVAVRIRAGAMAVTRNPRLQWSRGRAKCRGHEQGRVMPLVALCPVPCMNPLARSVPPTRHSQRWAGEQRAHALRTLREDGWVVARSVSTARGDEVEGVWGGGRGRGLGG